MQVRDLGRDWNYDGDERLVVGSLVMYEGRACRVGLVNECRARLDPLSGKSDPENVAPNAYLAAANEDELDHLQLGRLISLIEKEDLAADLEDAIAERRTILRQEREYRLRRERLEQEELRRLLEAEANGTLDDLDLSDLQQQMVQLDRSLEAPPLDKPSAIEAVEEVEFADGNTWLEAWYAELHAAELAVQQEDKAMPTVTQTGTNSKTVTAGAPKKVVQAAASNVKVPGPAVPKGPAGPVKVATVAAAQKAPAKVAAAAAPVAVKVAAPAPAAAAPVTAAAAEFAGAPVASNKARNQERLNALKAKQAVAQTTAKSASPTGKKVKGPKEQKPCMCGCGQLTGGFFFPGHDATFKSKLMKIERGDAAREELLSPEVIASYEWVYSGRTGKAGQGVMPTLTYKGEPHTGYVKDKAAAPAPAAEEEVAETEEVLEEAAEGEVEYAEGEAEVVE